MSFPVFAQRYLTPPLLVAAVFALVCGVANAQSAVIVPGTSNPWLAGMPAGSTSAGGDTAPAESPVQVSGLSLSSGAFLTFSVTGSVLNTPGTPTAPPDGTNNTGHPGENGFPTTTAPLNSLMGVFLDNTQPNLSAAPAALNFSTIGTNFANLTPELKQVFFIGDGLTGNGSGAVQQFFAPAGATRFFLGTMDGSGWFNNSGQFNVTVTSSGGVSAAAPEPGTLALLALTGVPLVVSAIHRRRSA